MGSTLANQKHMLESSLELGCVYLLEHVDQHSPLHISSEFLSIQEQTSLSALSALDKGMLLLVGELVGAACCVVGCGVPVVWFGLCCLREWLACVCVCRVVVVAVDCGVCVSVLWLCVLCWFSCVVCCCDKL